LKKRKKILPGVEPAALRLPCFSLTSEPRKLLGSERENSSFYYYVTTFDFEF